MANEQMLAAVDDALRTYPLAPAPASLRPGVMARLRALAPAPRFRLQFIDYAVSLFGALMVGLNLLLWQSISPQTAALAQLQLRYLAQLIEINTAPLGPALTVGLSFAALAGVAGVVVLGRSRTHSTRF